MASLRNFFVFAIIAITATACSSNGGDSSPVVTRALLPASESAAPVAETTTTTVLALSPAEADRRARIEIRYVLTAAEEIYSETGSYDAEPAAVAALTEGIEVVSLEQAAQYDAVAYSAFDQRLTLHRQSASGRWFCIDVDDRGADHGAGDTFDAALEDCTDGVRATGWGNVFSPTGPDESAITAVINATFDAFEAGDTRRAHELFDTGPNCDLGQLEALWPAGLPLTQSAAPHLENIVVAGDAATASVSSGFLSDPTWPLTKRGSDWLNGADPCELLGPPAADLKTEAARDTLERGLFAVRSMYVKEQSFSFSPSSLADIDADLVVVSADEVSFGTIAYRGTPQEGLLVTAAEPGVFYCAVESSYALTVYGEGSTAGEINTVGRCRAHATS